TAWARSMSSSVVLPMADTTTTTSLPARRVSTIRSATRLIRSGLAADVPPYFWTTMLIARETLGGYGGVSVDTPHHAARWRQMVGHNRTLGRMAPTLDPRRVRSRGGLGEHPQRGGMLRASMTDRRRRQKEQRAAQKE